MDIRELIQSLPNFRYDPFGRRIQKSGPLGTTNYVYEEVNLLEEVDTAGNVLAKYAQGASIDEPLSMLRTGSASYYSADALGSITSLGTSTGALANTYTYDAFGKLIVSTGSLTNPFQYTGRDYDPETGLRFYRARYYDPSVGRFLSEDPAGFGGGINAFAYVKNDPADFTDPTGLKCWQSSPWTEIPNVWGPNGPTPYLTMQDGLYWVRVGWSYVSWGLIPDYTHCSCQWVAEHTRMRKFYRYTVKEQAQFTCDCGRSFTETRERAKNYEVDSPGNPSWPTEYTTSQGPTYQAGENTGSNPRNKKNVGCACPPPAP